eukprot:4282074-Pyramimonas_sp.AAC.1
MYARRLPDIRISPHNRNAGTMLNSTPYIACTTLAGPLRTTTCWEPTGGARMAQANHQDNRLPPKRRTC